MTRPVKVIHCFTNIADKESVKAEISGKGGRSLRSSSQDLYIVNDKTDDKSKRIKKVHPHPYIEAYYDIKERFGSRTLAEKIMMDRRIVEIIMYTSPLSIEKNRLYSKLFATVDFLCPLCY